ncbi:hypothetical protein BKA61DRAFT_662667 [Leptodontidium sp. MPI-SDFR-AT-0119]|nr:hypothetical protein BKA61DRAFT_662667 [Leptodontidium sp. MPI-SDFR-AT-0119]
MPTLFKALDRLREKVKQKKNEIAPKPHKPFWSAPQKTVPHQVPAQASFSRTSNITTTASSIPNSQEATVQKPPPPPVLTSTVAATRPKPQTTQETPKLVDAKEDEDQSKPSSSRIKLGVDRQSQPPRKASVPAREIVPHPVPVYTISTPKATSQPLPVPTVAALKTTSKYTPQAPRQATNPVLKSISKPTVHREAGFYSGGTPEVAAVDQPTPKLVYEAKQTASAVLQCASPFADLANMRNPHTIPDGRLDLAITPRVCEPLGVFHTGGPVGGGLYASTGGAIGGGVISQTSGSFGEGSVSQTGGSLGEAVQSFAPSQAFRCSPMAAPLPQRPLSPPLGTHTPWRHTGQATSTSYQVGAISDTGRKGKPGEEEGRRARELLEAFCLRRGISLPHAAAGGLPILGHAPLVSKVQEHAQKHSEGPVQHQSMFSDEYVDDGLYDSESSVDPVKAPLTSPSEEPAQKYSTPAQHQNIFEDIYVDEELYQ